MSWRYKMYSIQPEQVVTIDPINDNFVPFTDEFSGGLNEHNFPTATGKRLFQKEPSSIQRVSSACPSP
jgi:hypothetical protein